MDHMVMVDRFAKFSRGIGGVDAIAERRYVGYESVHVGATQWYCGTHWRGTLIRLELVFYKRN